ncbi:MAG: dienelactone hydrolase family protein [Candidatus Hinthialibacter antarcticus]|nr:dienelactone hydrolase family protein [Candidatus Hinthialibacter antarcticus]
MKKAIINLFLIGVIIGAGSIAYQKLQRMNQPLGENELVVEPYTPAEQHKREREKLIDTSRELDWSEVVQLDVGDKQYENASKVVQGRAGFKYICFLPRGFGEEEGKKYPLLLMLHGAGAKGDDLSPLYNSPALEFLLRRDDSNFLYVAPLCPADSGWNSRELNRFLSKIMGLYPVDKTRVYLTGISMGGHGTWNFASDFPNRFAAVAPFCGAGDPQKARVRLRNKPILIVHGAKDDIVPVGRAYDMIYALEPVNPNLKYTIFPDMGHGEIAGLWGRAVFYVWLLNQQNKNV